MFQDKVSLKSLKKANILESPQPPHLSKFSNSMLSNNHSLFNTPMKPRFDPSNLYPYNSEVRSNASKLYFPTSDLDMAPRNFETPKQQLFPAENLKHGLDMIPHGVYKDQVPKCYSFQMIGQKRNN